MKQGLVLVLVAYGAAALTADGPPDKQPAAAYPFSFRDVGDEAGLFPHVGGIKGHGAAWGDVDGDGWLDLYVATFYSSSTKRNQLFRNAQGKFRLDEQEGPRLATRATGVIFADLNNDGHLDLYVASMPKPAMPGPEKGTPLAGCSLFRNDGAGKLTNISEGNGACPPAFGGRSATVLDFDGDGLPRNCLLSLGRVLQRLYPILTRRATTSPSPLDGAALRSGGVTVGRGAVGGRRADRQLRSLRQRKPRCVSGRGRLRAPSAPAGPEAVAS